MSQDIKSQVVMHACKAIGDLYRDTGDVIIKLCEVGDYGSAFKAIYNLPDTEAMGIMFTIISALADGEEGMTNFVNSPISPAAEEPFDKWAAASEVLREIMENAA